MSTSVDNVADGSCADATETGLCEGTDTGDADTSEGNEGGEADGDGDGDATTTGDGDGDGDGDANPDDVPPTILGISPAPGSVGVLPGAVITIEFSEPMDKTATQAAYYSADLPAADVTMTWDISGSTLTITPNEPLDIATGNHPGELEAFTYAYLLTTEASDLAGNPLASPAEVDFATARRILYPLLPIDELTGSITLGTTTKLSSCLVGDNYQNQGAVMLATFGITGLGQYVLEFERAMLRAEQTEVTDGTYADLGAINLELVQYNQFDLGPVVAGTDLGVFSDSPNAGWVEYDALDLLKLGASLEAERLQLRFAFDAETDDDGTYDRAWFDCGTMYLDVHYLIE